jgi:hypothetical protein
MEKAFTLCGYGYIRDLDLTGEVPWLSIEVASLMTDASEPLTDRIFIDCKATPELKRRLAYLDRQYPAHEGVSAWFRVVYHRLAFCQMRKTDEKHAPSIVKFVGELQAVEHWLRDGSYAF